MDNGDANITATRFTRIVASAAGTQRSEMIESWLSKLRGGVPTVRRFRNEQSTPGVRGGALGAVRHPHSRAHIHDCASGGALIGASGGWSPDAAAHIHDCASGGALIGASDGWSPDTAIRPFFGLTHDAATPAGVEKQTWRSCEGSPVCQKSQQSDLRREEP